MTNISLYDVALLGENFEHAALSGLAEGGHRTLAVGLGFPFVFSLRQENILNALSRQENLAAVAARHFTAEEAASYLPAKMRTSEVAALLRAHDYSHLAALCEVKPS